MAQTKESSKAKTTSRLVARLREISRGQTTPLGFARAAVTKLPSMLLLAEIDVTDPAAAMASLSAGADGAVLRVGAAELPAVTDSVRKVASQDSSRPIAVLLDGPTAWSADDISALATAGADCVIVRPSRAPAGLLKVETLGHVALVDGDLSKFPIRGLNEQHVDAILLVIERPADSLPSVTVQDVATWRSTLEAFRRPVMLPASAGMLPSDLEFVRESGSEALLLTVPSADVAAATVGAFRSAIDALGPPVGRGRGSDGRQVILPQVKAGEDADDDEDDG
jgi:hypothetical protein